MGDMIRLGRAGESLLKYFVHFFVFMMMATGIHEWFHLGVLRILGGDGHIKMTWFGGVCIVDAMPRCCMWLFYLSGGAFTALVFFLLSWFHETEIEERCAVLPYIINQCVYAIYECVFITRLPFGTYIKYGMLLGAMTFSIGIIIGFWILLEHILETPIILRFLTVVGRRG